MSCGAPGNPWKKDNFDLKTLWISKVKVKYELILPNQSMYGIFTCIYHRYQPNVGKYTIHGSDGLCQINGFNPKIVTWHVGHVGTCGGGPWRMVDEALVSVSVWYMIIVYWRFLQHNPSQRGGLVCVLISLEIGLFLTISKKSINQYCKYFLLYCQQYFNSLFQYISRNSRTSYCMTPLILKFIKFLPFLHSSWMLLDLFKVIFLRIVQWDSSPSNPTT